MSASPTHFLALMATLRIWRTRSCGCSRSPPATSSTTRCSSTHSTTPRQPQVRRGQAITTFWLKAEEARRRGPPSIGGMMKGLSPQPPRPPACCCRPPWLSPRPPCPVILCSHHPGQGAGGGGDRAPDPCGKRGVSPGTHPRLPPLLCSGRPGGSRGRAFLFPLIPLVPLAPLVPLTSPTAL